MMRDALEVPCPFCGAGRGESCHSGRRSLPTSAPHASRWDAATSSSPIPDPPPTLEQALTMPVHFLLMPEQFAVRVIDYQAWLRCTICDEVVCEVEDDDELSVLVGVAVDHQAKGCEPPLSERFDVAPICKECADGHHGACNGAALVDGAEGVTVAGCGCHAVDHRVHEGATS